MKLAHDITVKLSDVDEICERFSVQELSLFGSALGPSFNYRSDLDFLVEFKPGTPVGLFHLIRMQHELEDLFERRVDLVPKRDLRHSIRDEILKQAQVLYAR